MIGSLKNIAEIPELRNRVLFTLSMLAHLPAGSLHSRRRGSTSEEFQEGHERIRRLHLRTAGRSFRAAALQRLTVFALGIMPYITASIVLQLLTVVSPTLAKAAERGRTGPSGHHPLHALPDGGFKRLSGFRRGDRRFEPADAGRYAPGRQPGLDVRFYDGPDADGRIAFHHVAGRTDYGAGNRQRHVAVDLSPGSSSDCPPRCHQRTDHQGLHNPKVWSIAGFNPYAGR